jgi:hypothetical protein
MDLSTIIANRNNSQPTQPEQNLINPSKVNTAEKPAGFYKSIILDVVCILSAGLFGYSYYRYLTRGTSVWFVFGALVFFGALSVLQVFLAKESKRTFLIIFAEVLALLGFFWQENYFILGMTALIVLAMLLWGYFAGRARLRNSINVPFFGASGTTLGKFTTGLLLFMILTYVPQLSGGNALVVSQQSFRTFFDWTSGFVNNYFPTLSLTGSFGNFSESFAKMELQNNPNFQSLNTAQQNLALQQASTQFATSFASPASTTIATSSPTSDAFYNVLNGVLSAWQSQSSGWFDVGWVTVLFIGLRTLGILFVWLDQFIALIFYEILLASGFMKISEENRSREIIVY